MKEKLSITWKAPTKQKEFYFQKKKEERQRKIFSKKQWHKLPRGKVSKPSY